MTDNKDPQITPEMVQEFINLPNARDWNYTAIFEGRTLRIMDLAHAYLQQAEELSQLRAERQGLLDELQEAYNDPQGDIMWRAGIARAMGIIKSKLTDSAPSNNGWQDISTAPKDGTKILAYLIDNAEHRKSFPENERNGIDIIVWTNHNKGGWISNRFGTPTHWMPLPDKSKLIDASSSNGRTPDFDSGDCGSNPREAAKLTDSAQSIKEG